MGALQLSPRWFIVPLFLGTFKWLGKFLLTIPRLDKLRTGFHQPLQDRRSRSVKEKPVLQQENLKSPRWATWSALAFYFLGRHFKPSDNLAFANAEESYILAAINGHFVVQRFIVSASFNLLSVPAVNASSIVFLSPPDANQPKACKQWCHQFCRCGSPL